jgi:penicillin-binding protein 1A
MTFTLHGVSERLAALIRAHGRLFVAIVVVISIMAWTGAAASAWFVRGIAASIPDTATLHQIGAMAQATTLLDVQGQPAFTIFKEQRIEVPLERVSRHLMRAVIAIEDQRFYEHGGIDIVRVGGAALRNLRLGRAAEGGSTITQQLARQSFLTTEKTYRRKLTEMIVAARLERQFTKDQILELYLNKVYFGDGLHGVEAASLGYFGKPAAELGIAEAALLAGLVQSPSAYAPTVNLERAVARRNVVLQAMRGSGAIDQATYDAARREPVQLEDALRRDEAYGQYFKEEVRKQLVQQFGWERVYQGGLRVYTTLDLEMQKAAEAEVARALSEIDERQKRARRRAESAASEDPLQAALVAMDPGTGEVRALVGGRDFAASKFNRATQAKRQPGSAFKPFVYAAALERGFTPATLITNLDTPIQTLQGAWVPEDEHLESPSMTMRTALRTSSNRAAVQMLDQVGIPVTVRYAERLGVGSVPNVPSLALGSGEVTLLSMTAAFGAFANEGMRTTPTLIRRVETTEGEVLYTGAQPQQRAVSEATAFMMTSMMADVINSGTAWPARRVGFTLPAAGKTGTTNDYHDAWFVGFTPSLVAGVWIGYDQPRTIVSNGYAGELAVPLWGRFMKVATNGDEPEWFRAPSNVGSATICRLSGKLATNACRDVETVDENGDVTRRSMAYTEHFVRGTEPHEDCPLHSERRGIFATLFGSGRDDGSSTAVSTAPAAPASPAPVTAAPPAPTPPSATVTDAPDPQPERRRGFWSRLFGRRDRDDAREQQEREQPQERQRQQEQRRDRSR